MKTNKEAIRRKTRKFLNMTTHVIMVNAFDKHADRARVRKRRSIHRYRKVNQLRKGHESRRAAHHGRHVIEEKPELRQRGKGLPTLLCLPNKDHKLVARDGEAST